MRKPLRCFLRAAISLLTLAPMLALAEPCTGLCLQQVTCANPFNTTRVSGRVYAPNGADPLPGVLVYVPNAPVEPLPAGAACRNGGTPPTAPLVQAITEFDGTFEVKNMPVGTNIPLVIQSGKWRRQIVIPSVAACTTTPISAAKTRFPKNHAEGDIPHFAVVTGSLDAAECIFRKMGIDDAEFSGTSDTGHIQLFTGADDAGGGYLPGSASETVLEASSTSLNSYDTVILACQNAIIDKAPAVQQNLIDYVNGGGRVMATHYEYTWLYNIVPFSGTTTWIPQSHPAPVDQLGYVNQSTPDGLQLAQWLMAVNASTTQGQIPLKVIRHDFDGVIAPSESWLSINDAVFGNMSVQYSFDTPIGTAPEDQCGRVQYLDYHVENVSASSAKAFPQECVAGPMTPQEKLLEYMVFDLTSELEPPLILTVDDRREFARYGNTATYTVTLANHTNKDLAGGATVTIALSPGLDAANATCVGINNDTSTCAPGAPGTLIASATYVGSSTYTTWVITVPVLPGTPDTTVEVDASTTGAPIAMDVDTLVPFHDSFDVPNADGTQ